jgi:acetyltransferase-like isoleucine patch superfamily enzyme
MAMRESVKKIAFRLLIFIFQRIFLVNHECKFPVHFTSRISFPENILLNGNSETILDSFLFSGHCYIQAMNGIIFGEGTIIAPGVKIISANHDLKDLSFYTKSGAVKIGKFSWIGSNAVILPGVELGDHTVVGAGAVVSKSFPAYCVLAGNPASIAFRRCEKCLDKVTGNDLSQRFCTPCLKNPEMRKK